MKRQTTLALMAVLLLAPVLFTPAITRAQIVEVEAIGFTVSNLERSIDFFTKVLQFELLSQFEMHGTEFEQLQGVFGLRMRVARLQLGDEVIELTQYLAPPGGRPIPVDARSNDEWFQHIAIVVSDMDAAYAHLRKHNVAHVSSAPQTIPESNEAAAGIRAFYFRDPDQHNLEIIYFPPGKGDPRWQNRTDLFLGIDHAAIVVRDTEISLDFYENLLGLNVAGESFNQGTEQEHLNNVEGARLHITGLRAARGPGIEFLDYLHPTNGRPTPTDIRANDLMHWQTDLVVDSVEEIAQRLRAAEIPFVSTQVSTMPAGTLHFRAGLIIRDPDGHALRLIE